MDEWVDGCMGGRRIELEGACGVRRSLESPGVGVSYCSSGVAVFKVPLERAR